MWRRTLGGSGGGMKSRALDSRAERVRRAAIGLAGLLRCLPLPWSVLPKGPTGNTEGRQGQGSVNSEQPLRGGLARESMILPAGISEPRPFSALLVHLLASFFRPLPFARVLNVAVEVAV